MAVAMARSLFSIGFWKGDKALGAKIAIGTQGLV